MATVTDENFETLTANAHPKVKELIKKLMEAGCRVSYADMANNPKALWNRIGFQYKGKHVYHWFDVLDSGNLLFNHSYSQNTGKSNSCWKAGCAVKEAVEKMTGIVI